MISAIVLRNFGPFRGEHRLDLAPTTYAVVARREDDPEASNFSGKSWFLSAIRFALFGSHLADREDGWVTRGEGEGSVVLTLADGLAVDRSRTVGKSTQLVVGDARGRDAQQLVERRIGLCEADFLAASFFRQKAMARFVDARPSDRSAEVSAWLRLESLQRAHKRATAMAADVERLERDAAAREASLRGRLDALTRPRVGASPVGPACSPGRGCGLAGCAGCSLAPDPVAHSAAVVKALESRARGAAECARVAERELGAARLLVGQARAVQHREQLRAEVAALDALGDDGPDVAPLRARAEEAGHARRVAEGEVRNRKLLAAGRFSGECPVNARECPVRAEINEDLGAARSLLHEANHSLSIAMTEELFAGDALAAAQRALDALAARRIRLLALREQLALADASAPPLGPGTGVPDAGEVRSLEARAEQCRGSERAAAVDLDRARRAATEIAQLTAEVERAAGDRLALAAQLRTRREAVSVLGRGGVQRRVAEGALREVQAGANALLSEAGVDLDVRLLWDRPTDQPAAVCDACDAPLPPSRRVKACARCGAPRGPKLAEGLDVELSKVSGFAEDAAGIALSLTAGAWLRRERDVQWPVLCADEPFAAADVKSRRDLLNLFKIAGRLCGIRQMFLVAHSDALMDTLPGRIEVVAGSAGSRVSVVS